MTHPFSHLANERLRAHTRTNPRFAKVYFGARIRFDLTLGEVVLCDLIEILSRKTGWCFASRGYLGTLLGVSERSVCRMVARLEEKRLIERHPGDERQLRPTMLWITENQQDDLAGGVRT